MPIVISVDIITEIGRVDRITIPIISIPYRRGETMMKLKPLVRRAVSMVDGMYESYGVSE